MSLVVAVNGTFQSYFHPEYMGSIRRAEKVNVIENELHDLEVAKEANSKVMQNIKSYQKNERSKKKRSSIFAKDIMSKGTVSVTGGATIAQALNKMQEYSLHHLLVIEEEKILGIISDRDLLKNISSTLLVRDIMNEKVLLCHKYTEIRLMAKTMLEEGISSLPVFDDEHQVLGIVTKSDLLGCIVKNMPLELWI